MKGRWLNADSFYKKLVGVIGALVKSLEISIEMVFFIYTIPILSFLVIRPLRRFGIMAVIAMFLLIAAVIMIPMWEDTFVPLVSWIGQITVQLVDAVELDKVTFSVLFPVLAGTIFGTSIIILVMIARLIQWVFRKLDVPEDRGYSLINELSYLLNPLYGAQVREGFEQHLIKLNEMQNIQRICVVCDHTSALLAYEVLSRICSQRDFTPTYLITNDITLAGFSASPTLSLWLLVDPEDWNRFSKPAPRNLSWHYIYWIARNLDSFDVTSPNGDKIAKLNMYRKNKIWEKPVTAFTDHLIKSLKL